MAQMSGTKPSKPMRGPLKCLRVEIKGNGFEVTKDYAYLPSNGCYIGPTEKIDDSNVFETWDATKAYLDKCIASKNDKSGSSAEEAAEGE